MPKPQSAPAKTPIRIGIQDGLPAVTVRSVGEGADLGSGLDPVVQAAMAHLTLWVYPPLRERIRRRVYGQDKWERNLKNPSNRAAAIHTCKHLKHHGYDFPPDQLRDWALAHGWRTEDAEELHAYAAGVLAGTRYHTWPDPIGMRAIYQWREDAASTSTR
jgi:hypothetical protein